jgi:hypothetical protein
MKYYSLYFAQAYGEGDYGECPYSPTDEQFASCAVAAGGTGTGSNSGGLTDTGVAILVIVTIACLIVFTSLIVRIWRRPRLVPQEVEPGDEQEPELEQRQ